MAFDKPGKVQYYFGDLQFAKNKVNGPGQLLDYVSLNLLQSPHA